MRRMSLNFLDLDRDVLGLVCLVGSISMVRERFFDLVLLC